MTRRGTTARPRARAPGARLACVAALALALAAGCDGPRTGRDVETWRFAIEETPGSVQDAYAQRFKQLVEERTGGAVRVVVYPYGALGTSDDILEQVHTGTVDFAMSSPGHLGKLIPEVQVFLLHYTLSENRDVNRCALSDAGVKHTLDTLYREKGLSFLSVFSEGFMVWTTQKPVHEPADFQGMKFRVMTSPLLIAAYQAYGASPTPLPYGEVYGGLQLHMIDGQVNPVFAIEEMSFYEVTDWMIFAGQAPFVTTVAASPEFLAGLSPARRAMLDTIVGELETHVAAVERRFNRERLDLIRERKPEMHVLTLDAAERARFEQAAAPVRKVFGELAGQRGLQLLSTLEQAVERCRGTARR